MIGERFGKTRIHNYRSRGQFMTKTKSLGKSRTNALLRRVKALRPLVFNNLGLVSSSLIGLLGIWDTISSRVPWLSIDFIPSLPWYVWTNLILLILVISTFEAGFRHSSTDFELSVALQLSSNIPLPPHGRYVGLKIRNRSPGQVKDFWVRIVKYWRDGNEITVSSLGVQRKDAFVWSSWEALEQETKRRGKMDFEPGQRRIVDLFVLGPEHNEIRAA